jgi:hypothetical protein
MESGRVSKEYPYVLIREECDAFRTKEDAIRQAKKQWACLRDPCERVGYYIAKVELHIEPKYDIEIKETPIGGSKS